LSLSICAFLSVGQQNVRSLFHGFGEKNGTKEAVEFSNRKQQRKSEEEFSVEFSKYEARKIDDL
jgi:hypothetical protein